MNNKIEQKKLVDFEDNVLKKDLIETSKEELISMLLNFSQNYDSVENDLKLKYANESELLDICLNIMKRYISQATIKGFIPQENIEIALSGVKQVLENIYKLIGEQKFINSIGLSMAILSVLIPIIEIANDKEDKISYLIDRTIETVAKSVRLSMEANKSKEYKREIYSIIIDNVKEDYFYPWIDWRIEILSICVVFCEDTAVRDSLVDSIEELIYSGRVNKWHRLLVEKELKNIIYNIKYDYASKGEAVFYAEKNLEYGFFKNIAIKAAFENEKYEKVIYLANKEIENIGVDFSNDIDKYLYGSYVALGDKENQRVLSEKFLLKGDLSYYVVFKQLSSEKNWKKTFNLLLELLQEESKYSNPYMKLILLEERYDKLIEACVEDRSVLLEYGKTAYIYYPDEIRNLLNNYLEEKSRFIKDRDDYKEIAKIIRVYAETVGKNPTYRIINDFRQVFKRNSVFIEELDALEESIKSSDEETIDDDNMYNNEEKNDFEDVNYNGKHMEAADSSRGKIIDMPFK